MKAVRVGALWCPSCLIMRSRWNKVFAAHPEIEIEEVDYDEQPQRVENLAVGTLLPVVILMKNDLEVTRVIGEKSAKDLARWAEEWLR
ncbi:MAG TPA: thioredoxin family protein [Candidatus Izemoplasmatales bacterium]|nr:thioredoxin family protein [Candidatus Izemoplasmatales bacterium]